MPLKRYFSGTNARFVFGGQEVEFTSAATGVPYEEEQEEKTMSRTCRCRHAEEMHFDDGYGDRPCDVSGCPCMDFQEDDRFPAPPTFVGRSRFHAVAEEMTKPIASPVKPDDLTERRRVPVLFQDIIRITASPDGTVLIPPCPKCGTSAFTPNSRTTEVTCRGCPLPAPVYACEVDLGQAATVVGNRYTCCRCNRDSRVTAAQRSPAASCNC